MNEADWKKVKSLLDEAMRKPASERELFLAAIKDNSIRHEVGSLLSAHDEIEDFIEEPAFRVGDVFVDDHAEVVEKRFGNYRIVREIGSGGMGAVFLAERDDGEFSQQVALKIIRQAVADTDLIERFKRERQILANLNHPNIAKLLDGGVSPSGDPFLAMEYIDGESLSGFVERRNLDLDSRLRLFLKICGAVQFAHRNLIVHRDIKPTNILVTNEGEPKLLDFGLAKLTQASDVAQTQTAFNALTPAYASPEQLRNEPITTASDIYSLGVVLYELLASEKPFQFEGKSIDDVIKTVTQREPVAPSANAKAEVQKLKGDLDNIVLTALRKEPVRRYQSVEAFADDIERYLRNLPVSARPNTFQYRAGKYFQRHKIGVVAAGLILMSLIGGIVVSVWQTRVARREKANAEKVNQFLAQMLNYSDPSTAVRKGESELITIKDVLDKAARQIESEDFSTQPNVKIQLNQIIGNSYYTQGFYEFAEKHFRIALDEQTKLTGARSRETIGLKLLLSQTLVQRGKRTEADEIFQETIPFARTEFRNGSLDAAFLAGTLESFAVNRRALGNSKEAEELLREALGLAPFMSDKEKAGLSVARGTFALTLYDQGKLDEAISVQSELVNELQQTGSAETWEFGYAIGVLGGFLSDRQRFTEAEENLTKAEAIYRRLVGNSHLFLGDNLRTQANSLYEQGRFAEADVKIDATLMIYRANTGTEYINYPTALVIKGLILNKTGKSDEAEKLLREALEIREKNLPSEHFLAALARSALGECLTTRQKYDEAAGFLNASLESLKKSQGADNPRTIVTQNRLNQLNEQRKTRD